MRANGSLLIPIILLCLSVHSQAQSWSGILQPPRAVDWTHAGIAGGLPDTGWTQCGATIAAYSGGASAITTQLARCSANQYVQLGAGTFTLTGQITFPRTGHVALRGMGANSTFLVMSGPGVHCNQTTALICMMSSDGTYTTQPPAHIYNWTAGYSQGSNQITLSSTSLISTATPTLLFLDQCDTGYSGTPCTGSATDNGQLFTCGDRYTGTTGCSSNGPDAGGSRPERTQLEIAIPTAINGKVVTISPPLKLPNWTSGQSPQVWIVQSIAQVGVENLAIDGSNSGVAAVGVEFGSAYNWWVSGVKFTYISKWCINAFQTANGVVQNNYLYHTTGPDSYGVRISASSNELVQNNIIQQVFAPVVFDGSGSGNVVGYNFVDQVPYNSDYMRGSFFEHATSLLDLYEGNIAGEQYNDGDHGSADMITRFRNFYTGWESFSTAKDSSTNALNDQSFDRYENTVGNVLGTPGYHNAYQTTATPSSNTAVVVVGSGNGGASPPIPSDPLTKTTSMFWANYDVVTNAVRFCGNSSNTGWSTICGSISEVPTAISPYPNSVPTLGDTGAGQSAMPGSFYLSSEPAWFGSLPWPPIGPDVRSGNIGICSGGPYNKVPATSSSQCSGGSLVAGLGGHANTNPAMNCYLNVMGGPPDGSGGVLAFDASSCYGRAAAGSSNESRRGR